MMRLAVQGKLERKEAWSIQIHRGHAKVWIVLIAQSKVTEGTPKRNMILFIFLNITLSKGL